MDNNDLFENLVDKEIDDLIKFSTPFSEENNKNIKAKFMQKAQIEQKKFPLKKMIISAAIASTFLVSTLVYAGVLDFSRIYKLVFGGNSNYIEEHIKSFENKNEVEELVDKNEAEIFIGESEYDGILVKLVSALNDEDKLRIFLTITDTVKDRLSETISLDSWGLSQGSGGGAEVIDYNQETKTATILITSLGSNHNGHVNFNINNIISGKAFKENQKESKINVYDILKNYTPQIIERIDRQKEYKNEDAEKRVYVMGGAYQNEKGEEIYFNSKLLGLEEKNIPFENIDWAYISNIGFVDGYLHIQTNKIHSENDLASINFLNAEGEIVYNGHLQINYIKFADAYGGSNINQYKDMVYEGITDLEELKDLSVSIDYLEMGNIIKGKWELSFHVPDKIIKTEIAVNREINLNGNAIVVDKIFLSPLGITMHLPMNTEYSNGFDYKDSVYVRYTDGIIVKLDNISIATMGNEVSGNVHEKESTLNFSGNIVELEKVESIVINDEVIPVFEKGDTNENY